MNGWERIEDEVWEQIIDRLPRPLTRQEASQDLRYFAGRLIRTGERRPKHPKLAQRWGWLSRNGTLSIKRVRLLIASGEWEDPLKGQAEDSQGAGKGQAKDRPETDKPELFDKEGQAKGRRGAGEGQAKGPTRDNNTGSPTPTTDPNTDIENEAIPDWARKASKSGASPESIFKACNRILETIRRKPVAPGPSSSKPILALWRALECPPLEQFEADVILVAEAAHDSPDPIFAREIRAEGWPDGTNRSRMEANICRQAPRSSSGGATWDARLEAARAWDAEGRPVGANEAPINGFKEEAELAWPWLLNQISIHGSYLQRPLRPDDPVKDEVLWRAIQAVGGVAALCGEVRSVERLRFPFIRAYVDARQETT